MELSFRVPAINHDSYHIFNERLGEFFNLHYWKRFNVKEICCNTYKKMILIIQFATHYLSTKSVSVGTIFDKK